MALSPEAINSILMTDPCLSSSCLSPKQQLVWLITQLNDALDDQAIVDLESVTKKFRNIGNVRLQQYLLAAFESPKTPDPCLFCYSEEKLTEILYYLLFKLVKAQVGP
jgi:hypothetical protein